MKKKTHIRIMELPEDLRFHLISKVGFCIIGYMMIIALYIYSGMLRECVFLTVALSLYLLSVIYLFHKVLSGNIYVYEGICEKRCGKEHSLKLPMWKPLFTTWSYCYLVMRMQQKGKEIKVEVPCGYSFKAEAGNTIRIYAYEDRLLRKNENTYLINNPILVSVIKS